MGSVNCIAPAASRTMKKKSYTEKKKKSVSFIEMYRAARVTAYKEISELCLPFLFPVTCQDWNCVLAFYRKAWEEMTASWDGGGEG